MVGCNRNGHVVISKETCPTEMTSDDARGNDCGGDGGRCVGGGDEELIYLQEVNCCVVSIQCMENGYLPPPCIAM